MVKRVKKATTVAQRAEIDPKSQIENPANVEVIENAPECENPKEDCVTVTLRVEQVGTASPFAMETKITAKSKDVTVVGLAKKAAYALADGLHNVASQAMEGREKTGQYLTAFRPKSVFKVYIAVDGNMSFQAIKTKGLDAIRIMQRGKLVSRAALVQKMALLAEQSRASETLGAIFAQELAIDEAIRVEEKLQIELQPATHEVQLRQD